MRWFSQGRGRRLVRRSVWALGPSVSPLFPAGAGGGEGGATGVRTEGRGPARAPPPPPRRRLGAGPPSPPPLPTLRPVAPGARAHTHASPGSMQMRYPEAGGPGGGGGGKGVVPGARARARPRHLFPASALSPARADLAPCRAVVRARERRPPPCSPCRQCPRAAYWPPHPEGPPRLRAGPLGADRQTSHRTVGGGGSRDHSLPRYVPEIQFPVLATAWCEPCDPGKVAPVWTSCCVHMKRGCKVWGCNSGLVCVRPLSWITSITHKENLKTNQTTELFKEQCRGPSSMCY